MATKRTTVRLRGAKEAHAQPAGRHAREEAGGISGAACQVGSCASISPSCVARPTLWWWKSKTRGTPQRECRKSRSCRLKAEATSSFSTARVGCRRLGGCGGCRFGAAAGVRWCVCSCTLRSATLEQNCVVHARHAGWARGCEPRPAVQVACAALSTRGVTPQAGCTQPGPSAHTSSASVLVAALNEPPAPPRTAAARRRPTRKASPAAGAEPAVVGGPAAHGVLLAPVARVHAADGWREIIGCDEGLGGTR